MHILELWQADQIVGYKWAFDREYLEIFLEKIPGEWADDNNYEFSSKDKYDCAVIVDISNMHASDPS